MSPNAQFNAPDFNKWHGTRTFAQPVHSTPEEKRKFLRLDLLHLYEAAGILNAELEDDFCSTADTLLITRHLSELDSEMAAIKTKLRLLRMKMAEEAKS